MIHIGVAQLWLQGEVKSNRLKVRRVKSEDTLADIGTKVLSNEVIRKHASSMEYVAAQEEISLGFGLSNQSEQIRAVQLCRKSSLESTGGHARAATAAVARAGKSR